MTKLKSRHKRIKSSKLIRIKTSNYQTLAAIIIVAIVAAAGYFLFVSSHASTPYVSFKASAGGLTCGATAGTSSSASGDGSIVNFGGLPTSVVGTTTEDTTPTTLSTPIHFDDTQWNFPSITGGFNSLSVNVTPEADGTPDGDFFAVEFYFVNNTGLATGYLGLQTNTTGINAKGDILSVWGAVSVTGGAYETQFNEGGTGWSARNPFNWVVGQMYTYEFNYLSTQSDGEHWAGYIINDTDCSQALIGQIVVPASYGLLSNAIISFHERYAGGTSACSDMNLSRVQFTDPVFNNAYTPTSYNSNLPNVTGCTSDYGVTEIQGGYRSTIGGQ